MNATAATAYQARVNAVQAKLTSLQGLVTSVRGGRDQEALHWGHVGDLAHVEERLDEIIGFLGRGE